MPELSWDPRLAGPLTDLVRRVARDEIVPRFRNLGVHQVATKSGPGDLVTEADLAAESALTEAIRALIPGALVAGEESIAADPALRGRLAGPGVTVILDPVDGTWNFAKGLALFGVILAVAVAGRPVFGLLYDPLLDDWVVAEPGSATLASGARAAPLRTSTETAIDRMVGFVSASLFPRSLRGAVLAQFPPFSRVTSLRCACHEYRLVAQGHAEFTLSGPVHNPWDHAAGVLAVEAAGGVARFLDGEAYGTDRRRGVILAASSEAVWQEIAGRFAFLTAG